MEKTILNFHFDYLIIRLTPIYFLKSISIGLKNVALQNKVSVPISKLWPQIFWYCKKVSALAKKVSVSVSKNLVSKTSLRISHDELSGFVNGDGGKVEGGHIIQATPQSVSKVLRMAWAGHPSPALYAEGRYWLRNLPEMKIYLK